MSTQVCPACGARQDENAAQCELCGQVLIAKPEAPKREETESRIESEEKESAVESVPAPSIETEGKVCDECGAQNLSNARFCHLCGVMFEDEELLSPVNEILAGETDTASVSKATPASRTMLIVATGVVAVVILYMVTMWSSSTTSTTAPVGVAGGEMGTGQTQALTALSPVDPQTEAEVADRKQKIENSSDPEEIKQEWTGIVNAYVRIGRLDLAGDAQTQVAGLENTAEAWAQAGHLFYDWMETQPPGSPGQAKSAKSAIDMYKKSLEINPDDLNVQTDMGAAYLNDPDNPMLAIQVTSKVLEEDPDHLQANFNRGIMLWHIQRIDEAIAQFERVKTLVGAENPVYARAQQMLDILAQQTQSQSQPQP